jgi:two-component system cell cycle sensor histidine kinase/response regulator CckA
VPSTPDRDHNCGMPHAPMGTVMASPADSCRDCILAIDDEPELLDLVKSCLEPSGYQVYTALSAREGVELYEKHWRDIKLVLLDFLMPEMTGDLVFECLKRQNPDVRTILLTGCEEFVAERMFNEGLWGFIHKPFYLDDLIQQVNQAIDTV